MVRISNTDAADINEIMMGYFLADKKWSKFQDSADAKRQLKEKTAKVGNEEAAQQTLRAEEQAKEVLKWAKMHGFNGSVVKVWWTARPGVLAKAVGRDVDSRKNPTDVLIQFSSKQFLGISAKSTKTRGDIGFKNPGIGTIDKSLSIRLKAMVDKEEDKIVQKYALPKSKSQRKKYIRERGNESIKAATVEAGSKILSKIRDDLFKKLKTLSQDKLRSYVLSDWLDATDSLYPPYIKVTGMGKKPPYTAKVEDPLANEKISALTKGKITLEKVGNDSIGIKAGGKRILKMRSKYESEKIASSIKFSGDPWK
jgi:hypothetical protein